MAHTKSGGSTKNGRDSISKRLGVKVQDGTAIKVGQIILRQRGSHYKAGQNVGHGADDTLFALQDGKVKFYEKSKQGFDRSIKKFTFVAVV